MGVAQGGGGGGEQRGWRERGELGNIDRGQTEERVHVSYVHTVTRTHLCT